MTESVLATLRSSPTVLCVRFFFRTELWFNYHSLHLVTSHHRLFQFFLMRHLLALSSHLCAGRSHVLSRILLDWPFRALVCLAAAWPWSIRWYSSMSSISSPKREREIEPYERIQIEIAFFHSGRLMERTGKLMIYWFEERTTNS